MIECEAAAAREGARGASQRGAAPARREAFDGFCAAHAGWLDDFALFMALKDAHGGAAVDRRGSAALVAREPAALAAARRELARECRDVQRFRAVPVLPSSGRALRALRRASAASGSSATCPIFVAHDSADVWAHPELFHLDARRAADRAWPACRPTTSAPTGQLWGNPLYRWDALERDRLRLVDRRGCARVFELVDVVRLDHFRGFEAYWEVPGDATTAINGPLGEGPRRGALRGRCAQRWASCRSSPRTWA